MEPEGFAEKLIAAGYRTVEDVLFALETGDRSDVWVYLACDRDEDGQLRPVNASGFWQDEASAMLASETYKREWAAACPDEDPVEVVAVPFFLISPAKPDARESAA